jgi:peptidoglycan-associated lipoprotein
MKSVSQTLSVAILAGLSLLLTGCPKKPIRPDPSATAVGQGNGVGPAGGDNGNLSGKDMSADGLTGRDPNADANGQIRGKLDNVLFAFDRSTIAPAERPKLAAAKDYLDKNSQYRLLLEGHCDWRGTAEYNLALGDRRANEAKKYLIGLGVSPDKLDTLSKGSEEAAKNVKGAEAAKDRRVELVLLAPGAASVNAGPAAAGAPPAAAPEAGGSTGQMSAPTKP